MLTITFVNDKTGDFKIGNYDYEVFVNANKVAKGRIENHDRTSGWQGIVDDLSKVSHKSVNINKKCQSILELYKLLGN